MRRLLLAFALVLLVPASAVATTVQNVGDLIVTSGETTWTPWVGSTQTANLWVSASGSYGGCARSASLVAYNAATDCAPDAANDLCQGGDTAGIKGGSYGNVTITKAGAQSGRSSRCTMTVATGETATMGNLDLGTFTGGDTGPDYLTIQGNETAFAGCRDIAEGACSLRFTTLDSDQNNQVTVSNFEMDSAAAVAQCFHVESTSNFIASRGKIHNCRADGGTGGMIYSTGSNQTFEDLYAYDGLIKVGSTTSPHTECLYAVRVTGLTLRRVHMYSCSAEIIFLTDTGSASRTYPDLTVENSIFQKPNGTVGNHNAFAFHTGPPSPYPTNMLMRNNLFDGIQAPDSSTSATGSFYNNFIKVGGTYCGGSIACSNNDTSEPDSSFTSPVWTSNGDTIATPRGDFSLTAAAAAVTSGGGPLVNAGSPILSCPTVDFLGRARPFGAACDIGPYEYGAS